MHTSSVPLTLSRILVARLAGRRRGLAPLFGALLLAIALLVVLPETTYLCASAAWWSLLRSMPISTAAVQVQATALDSDQAISAFERDVRYRAANQVHSYLDEESFRIASAYFPVNSHNGKPLPTQTDFETVLGFANHSDLQAHADLVDGAWSAPAPPGTFSVSLSDSAAKRLDAKPGDRFCLANGIQANVVCLWIAGIWRQRDPTSAYWVGEDSLADVAEMSRSDLASPATQGPAGYHRATAIFALDLLRIEHADPAAVQDSLAHLGPALTGNAPYRQVYTGLDTAVADFTARSRVATFALQLITAQLWLVGLYCLIFLIGSRLEQDRGAVTVWRTRGWPRRLVATQLSTELITVGALALIPGVAIGFGLAVAVTAAFYPAVQLSIVPSLGALVPVVVGGLLVLGLAIVGLCVLAARVSVVRARAEASRPQPRWWNRPWVAAVSALVAIPILAQARLLGDARVREAGGATPYDLLLPGVGLSLIAFAAISLLPLIARAFGRVVRRLEARLAAMQLARSSGRQQRLSLLFAAGIAMALLAAAYSGTVAQNATDRASYAAGADLRVVTHGFQLTDLQSLPVKGAIATSEVFRDYATVGASAPQAQMLGVDPYTFANVAWTRPGLLSPDLTSLMRRLVVGEKGGTVLPDTAIGLSIWVYGEQTGGSLTASFTDADLMPVSASFGSLDFEGWRQLMASFAPSRFKAPLRLRHLTLTPVTKAGTVALSDLEAPESGGGSAVVFGFNSPHLTVGSAQFIQGFPGWWQSDGTTGAMLQGLVPDDRFPRNGEVTSHVFLSPGWLPVTINPPVFELSQSGGYRQLITLPVPVLVTPGLLDAFRARVGDSISVQIDNLPVNAVIVGTIDNFPTLYGAALVFSLPPLLQVLGGLDDPRPWPSELWVSGSATRLQADEATLMADPNVANVVSRLDLEDRTAADPLGPAGRADLVLGFLAACALAIAAFAIHFAFVARSRTSEYAILQANGLSPGQVARSVLIEQLFIIAFSTLLGLGLGAVLSFVLLPDLQVSTSVVDTIPPTVLAVNLGLAIGGIGGAIAMCLVAGGLVLRSARVADVMPELRALG